MTDKCIYLLDHAVAEDVREAQNLSVLVVTSTFLGSRSAATTARATVMPGTGEHVLKAELESDFPYYCFCNKLYIMDVSGIENLRSS